MFRIKASHKIRIALSLLAGLTVCQAQADRTVSYTTTYVRDDTGLELSRSEAAGTPQARTITTAWHPRFRKPQLITKSEHIIEYTYDSAGRQLSRTERPRQITQ